MAEYGAPVSRETLFVDGVADVFEQVARIHDGPRVLRDGNSVSFTKMEDILHVTKRRDVRSMDPDSIMLASMVLGAGRPLIPLMIDGELHTKYRKLLDPLFAPKVIAQLEPRVRQLADELIDGFIGKGEVDFFAEFCEVLPTQIFLALLGLPLEDAPFLLWVKDGIIRPSDDEHRSSASPKLTEYLYAELDRRKASGVAGDDLIGGFIESEVDGHRLTPEDVIDITFLLVLAGLDTVSSSLSCIVDWLARNPGERQRLLDDPSLWPAAIEELMRVQTPVTGGGRYATGDFEVAGEQIKEGDQLRMMWAVANLDPEVFDHPTTVDFDRDGNRHIAYASGFHRCLGSHLARMELRVALETLHDRIPDYTLASAPGYSNGAIRCVSPLPLAFTPR